MSDCVEKVRDGAILQLCASSSANWWQPRQVEQAALFYEFSLDGHVPADHLLRSLDRFVDLSALRRELAPFYSTMGRPSIDPELMIRMLSWGTASASDRSGACAMRCI